MSAPPLARDRPNDGNGLHVYNDPGSLLRSVSDMAPRKCTVWDSTRRLSSQTMNVFAEMRQKGQLTDVVLVTKGNNEFVAHRAILSGRSPFFRALFTSNFRERNKQRVELLTIGPEIMSEILNYAYTKQLELHIDNVQDIIVMADQLLIQGLVEICSEFMIAHIDDDNCMDIRRFSRWYSFFKLMQRSEEYFRLNFTRIWNTSEGFLEIPPEDLVTVLQDDRLNVRCESEVFEAVTRWIQHDQDDRLKYLPSLLRTVRMGLLPRTYFLEVVYRHPYIKDNINVHQLANEAFKIHYQFDLTNYPAGFPETSRSRMLVPRLPHQVMLAIGGWSVGSPTADIESYDIRAEKWVKLEDHGETRFGPRAYHGAVVFGSCIYIVGGFDGIEYYNSLRIFNTETGEWTEKAPMNCRRCYVSVAVLNGQIYAMGGFDGHIRMNTVERYDPPTNQWSHVCPMHAQRSDAHAAVCNEKIYICGGFNGAECMNTAEVYDPATNTWTLIENMQSRRSGIGVIARNGFIYAIGGFNGQQRLRTGERYEIQKRIWRPIGNMNSPRSNFALEVLEDKIFAVGGFNGSQTIPYAERFDEETNSWKNTAEMSLNRSALYAVVLANIARIEHYIYRPRGRLFVERLNDRRQTLRCTDRAIALGGAPTGKEEGNIEQGA